ncbi:hypothetical protein GQ55_5G133000 [Panicum hallii var. hallii]|uniref:Protein kinase domain-containing protein n=1 Tax=Panicum hallii var. hallii TaxID=1504633 RepID=A0A2T7DFU3_9POAL|nr:hypothetical protein GQ55_5G133000 [Panicum hallii var. hallii]
MVLYRINLQDGQCQNRPPHVCHCSIPANNRRLRQSVLIALAATISSVLLLVSCCWWFWRSKVTRKIQSEMALSAPSSENDALPFKVRMKHPSLSPVRDQPLDEDRKSAAADKDVDQLPLFDLEAILDATDNFAEHNKIGEGWFGPVYKGMLEDGQRVAVKKLAQGSMQGPRG